MNRIVIANLAGANGLKSTEMAAVAGGLLKLPLPWPRPWPKPPICRRLPWLPICRRPWPLLLVLHGTGATAVWTMRETGWDQAAARGGFLVAFPEGTPADPTRPCDAAMLQNPPVWNDGSGLPPADRVTADDVGFFRPLFDELPRRWAVDPRRAAPKEGKASERRRLSELYLSLVPVLRRFNRPAEAEMLVQQERALWVKGPAGD